MAKSTKAVAESYIDDIVRKFPGVVAEAIFESIGGYNVWIRVGLPPDLKDRFLEILDSTTELNERYWEEAGVGVVATLVDEEALFLNRVP